MSLSASHVSAGSVVARRPDVVDALLRLRSATAEDAGPGWSDATQRPVTSQDVERDRLAVTRSLGWAQESADRGDFVDALGWIQVVEDLGAQIPTSVRIQRHAWREALAATHPNDPWRSDPS